MTVFLVLCFILFLFIAFMWSSRGVINCLFKAFFTCMAIASVFFFVMQFLPSEIVLQNGMRLY